MFFIIKAKDSLRRAILYSTTAIIICACSTSEEPVSSRTLSTNEMSADMHISYSGGDSIFVEVILRKGPVGTTTDVRLDGGDRLIASTVGDITNFDIGSDPFGGFENISNQVKEMTEGFARSGGYFSTFENWYSATFSRQLTGETFSVLFQRTSGDDATGSSVTIPASFDIVEPTSEQVFSRASEDILASWDNVSTNVTMLVAGTLACGGSSTGVPFEYDIVLTDTGQFTIPAGSLPNQTGNCSVTLKVDRALSGQIDATFGQGGRIIGHQIRSVVFDSTL